MIDLTRGPRDRPCHATKYENVDVLFTLKCMGQSINTTVQSGGWEILYIFSSCAACINYLTFSGFEKIQVEFC